jgi:hypothetical protein
MRKRRLDDWGPSARLSGATDSKSVANRSKNVDVAITCTNKKAARWFIRELSMRLYGEHGSLYRDEEKALLSGEEIWFSGDAAEAAANASAECPETGIKARFG